MSLELMLNAVNLSLVAFSSFLGDTAGQMFVFFIMAVAAAEAAVGLAIVLSLFRNKQTVYVDEVNIMKW
jgi:NADH-quinone oxidoreductase subunit K